MKPSISLTNGAKLNRRYQTLLTEDWSERTLDGVLKLLTDQLPRSERGHIGNGEQSSLIPELLLPPYILFRVDKSARRGKDETRDKPLAKRADEAVFFLLFQIHYTIEGDSALFVDSQGLLYQCAVHVLLPALDDQKMVDSRRSLVAALWLHTLVWESDVAQMLYLRSGLFRYLNMKEDETDALVQSFRLTAPDQHDYLTKAQAAWMSMLDRKELSQAKQFMLGVYRACPESARAEVEEILDETYELAQAGGSALKAERPR